MNTEQPNPEAKSLIIRMKEQFGYEQVTVLKKEYDALTPKDRQDLIDDFNAQGIPTKP